MNSTLMKHRPAGSTPEQWEARWAAAGDILEPLAKALKEMQAGQGEVAPADFDTPNHYAKLIYELTRKQTIDKVLELFPKSAV